MESKRIKVSFRSFIRNYIIIFLTSILVATLQKVELLLAGSMLILFLIGEIGWKRLASEYEIGNSYISENRGIFRKTKTVLYNQTIVDVQVTQGIFGRIFNFGNLYIRGYKNSIKMVGIKDPHRIYKEIEKNIEKYLKKK